jgi:hypothetical protein
MPQGKITITVAFSMIELMYFVLGYLICLTPEPSMMRWTTIIGQLWEQQAADTSNLSFLAIPDCQYNNSRPDPRRLAERILLRIPPLLLQTANWRLKTMN